MRFPVEPKRNAVVWMLWYCILAGLVCWQCGAPSDAELEERLGEIETRANNVGYLYAMTLDKNEDGREKIYRTILYLSELGLRLTNGLEPTDADREKVEELLQDVKVSVSQVEQYQRVLQIAFQATSGSEEELQAYQTRRSAA